MQNSSRTVPQLLLGALLAVVLAIGLVPALQQGAEAATRYRISTYVTTSRVISGEAVWVRGAVTTSSGRPVSGVTVALQRRPVNSSRWETFAYRTTGASGIGLYPNRPGASYYYRAVVKGTGSVAQVYGSSKRVTLLKSGTRSLGYRADQLKAVIGSPTSVVGRSGTTAWQYYRGGLLVRRGETSQRTWLVQGKMLTAYKNAGGLKGRLGRPLQDIRCSLLESGCIQRFVGGTLYYSSTSPTVTIAYGSGKWTEHAAVAKSQIGYEEPAFRVNKYNTWVGGNYAWCGVFQSWASAASGNGSAVPKAKTYSGLISAVKSRGITGTKPAVGRLAFFDFNPADGRRSPTHAGFIVEVRSNGTIVTIEGNTTYSGGFTNERVVAQRVRRTADVVFYGVPY